MKTIKQIAISLLFLAFLAVLSIDSTFAGATGVMLQVAAMIFLILLTIFLAKHTRLFSELIEKTKQESNEA